MPPLPYTEISRSRISRGTNVNGSSTTIPAKRFVGYGTPSATTEHPIDLLSVTGAAKIKGLTQKAIAAGETGDVYTEGVLPAESDGSATIAAGDWLTVDAATGRVKTAAPAAGVNAQIVGKAVTAAAATAGAIVQCELRLSVMQG